ncbi:MAG: L,D-transpeptidase [Fusobacteriaceae bacterium]|nr:L,D-transpeptidase [Fusobacteriaceae bacterium]
MFKKVFAAGLVFCLLAGSAPALFKRKKEEKKTVETPLTWGTSIAVYDNRIPETIPYHEKYAGGSAPYIDYVFVATKTAALFKEPDYFTESAKTGVVYPYMTKLKALEKFNYKSNDWYKVEDEQGNVGYVIGPETRKRIFRFEMALDKVKSLERFILNETAAGREVVRPHSYSPNPANVNAKTQKDKYGTSWEQNTPAKAGNETVYIPDSSIMSIFSQANGKATVRVASIPEDLVIDAKYISRSPKIQKDFRKAVAVDIMNQNTMMFEKNAGGNWELISYVYSRTGIESNLGYETPKGNFIVPAIKYIMGYTDASGKQEGNARYAMRFSGGGYMHGTPLAFDEEKNREFVMRKRNGYLGLYTGTRKCIRTTEEHARFMFEWMCAKPNKNQNEQTPTENIMFVIF